MTKAYNTWSDRLDTGRLTKGQIQQFAAVISRDAIGMDRAGKASALTHDECVSLYARIDQNPVLLTAEHTAQGLDWLYGHGRKQLGLDDETWNTIIDKFSHFSWDGSIELHSNGYVWSHTPVWTVHLTNGERCRYWYAPGWREGRGNAGDLWWVD